MIEAVHSLAISRFRSLPRLLALHALPLAILMLEGCSAEDYAVRADRSVERILPESMQHLEAYRRDNVVYPESKAAGEPAPGAESLETAEPGEEGEAPADRKDAFPEAPKEPPEDAGVLKLSLRDAVEIAFQGNRGYIAEKESLYLSALGLVGTRHSYTPQLSAVLSYLFSDATGAEKNQNAGLSFGASQDLFYGGSLSISGDTSFNRISDSSLSDPKTFSSSLGVSLSQSLLRGAGRVAMESLIQAERNLVYAVRSFELRRQDFSIDVAQQYYSLVRQQQSIENQKQSLAGFIFSRRQAEAFFEVGLKNELDVLRARRDELNAKNDLIAAEEDLQLAIDRFKIFLGLPTTQEIEILTEKPEFVPLEYDIDSAVEAALKNRLDFLTRKEQLEDSERALHIAKNNLLPDLNLNLAYSMSGDPDPGFSNQKLDNQSYSAGLSLEIPLDRVQERNSYRQAQISHAQNLRAFEEFKDDLIISVRSAFRGLERRVQSREIQEQLIRDQERNLRKAQIEFESGEASNRDVVEAEQALLEARNSLVEEVISYEIDRLRLLRDLGILFIDEKGMWVE